MTTTAVQNVATTKITIAATTFSVRYVGATDTASGHYVVTNCATGTKVRVAEGYAGSDAAVDIVRASGDRHRIHFHHLTPDASLIYSGEQGKATRFVTEVVTF